MSGRLNNPKFLVGEWKLNNNAKDSSGHGNDGTWTGTETYAEGIFNNTVGKFDGSSAVNCGTDLWSAADLVKGTMSTWVSLANPGASIVQRFFCIETVLRFIFDEDYTDNFQFTLFDGTERNIDTGVSPVANKMYHLAATWNGTNISVYVDGNLISTTSAGSPSLDVGSNQTTIGANYGGGNQQLTGNMSSSRVYNIDLTQDEVKALYNQGQRNPKQVKVSFPLDTLPDLAG